MLTRHWKFHYKKPNTRARWKVSPESCPNAEFDHFILKGRQCFKIAAILAQQRACLKAYNYRYYRGGSRLVCRGGVSVSRSHMSSTYEPGGGGDTCVLLLT